MWFFLENKLDKLIGAKIKSIYHITYILMNTKSGIITKIKHFHEVFKDKRTYEIFKTVISGILLLKDWKQWDLANVGWKTLPQIQYFFYKSEWNSQLLNSSRVQWIRNKILWCANTKSDIAIFDATIGKKNDASSFHGLASWFFSNRDKGIVNGLEIFWASIMTKSWVKYMLNLSLFFKKTVLSSQDMRNPSLLCDAWRKFMTKTLSMTKAWLVVLDSWFKWANTCKWIFQVCKRHFLVRISQSQIFIDKNNHKFKIEDCLTKANAIHFEKGRMWVFKNVYLNSWIKKWARIPVNIIVYDLNWARNPMVLATSASLEDVYENMIRKNSEPSWKEKREGRANSTTVTLLWEEDRIYGCFIALYRKRWSIEECFKELKSYLCFEDFKVTSYESIMKYLHIILVVHTLLIIMTDALYWNKSSFEFVYSYLKEKRNMKSKKITLIWVKLFIEMMFQTWYVWKVLGKHQKTLAELLKTSICLKSVLSLS